MLIRGRGTIGILALVSVAAVSGAAALTTGSDGAPASVGPVATAATAAPPAPVPQPGGTSAGPLPRPRDRTRPTPSPLPSSAPTRLRVPAIDVAVGLIDLGLDDAGSLEVPQGPFPAGWYSGSPTPGTLGPAILAGHVSWNGIPGVFARLAELGVGDRVSVLRADGRVADFRVTRTAHYPKARFPTDAVYGNLRHAGLRLITCSGLDAATSNYMDNVVVYARLTGVRRA